MLELPQRHLCANVLAHCYKRNADHGKRLERVVSLRMVIALVQHPLDLKHIARPRKRADLDEDKCLLRHRVRDCP